MKPDLLMAMILATTSPVMAGDEPPAGASVITRVDAAVTHGGPLVRAQLVATDGFGTTREREIRVESSGNRGGVDRRLLVIRYEPECIELAREAAVTADEFCDRLAVTPAGSGLRLEYSSHDANKAFNFDLQPGDPGTWRSRRTDDVFAPTLQLTLENGRYDWSLETYRERYVQRGEIDPRQWERADLDVLEASLIPLTDVITSFISDEFFHHDLPREDPQHRVSPYSLWSEGPLDG